MAVSRLFVLAAVLLGACNVTHAQPSPKVQQRIGAAIKAAANATSDIDFTQFVNVFIGTDNFGDVWYVRFACMVLRLEVHDAI